MTFLCRSEHFMQFLLLFSHGFFFFQKPLVLFTIFTKKKKKTLVFYRIFVKTLKTSVVASNVNYFAFLVII